MKKITLIILTLTLLFACSQNNDTNNVNTSTVTATVNGIEYFFNNNPYGTVLDSETPPFFILAIAAEDHSISNEERRLLIIINRKFNFRDLHSGAEWNSGIDMINDLNEGVAVIFKETIGERDIDADDINGSVNIKITFIDKLERIISGEFEAIVYDSIYEETFTITNGVFNNINY